ncbi:MAG: amino acid adenylation domain-containing protein, partial [Rivularia sp. (in: cyanobacteria)]
LPLTLNGKVNRKALPAPLINANSDNFVAPRNVLEQQLVQIWSDVLKVEQIGVKDNFFELGGHSLLTTQLISRIRTKFAVDLPLRIVFEQPTLVALAEIITQKQSQSSNTLDVIAPVARDRLLPQSFAQARLWFLDRLEPNSASYNIPTVLRIVGQLNFSALENTLNAILERHEALRTNFIAQEGEPVQVIHPLVRLSLPIVDLQSLPETEREITANQMVSAEAKYQFNLASELLVRAKLLQLGQTDHILLLNMHHIVSDGWSTGILINELTVFYNAYCDRTAPQLPPLPIQYADFAVWQRQYLSGEVLSTQLDYWKKQLSGAPDLLQLPTDFPRPTVQTYQGCGISFSLNTDLTSKLRTLSRESGTTLFMTLYAAFSTLLYRYSGQSDILIGSPIANRNRSEIEGLIGFFVNTLVLRTSFEDNPSFKELLAQIRETTLKAYEHQDVPFEQVVEVLQPQRSLSHSPLFQVMFVLQNAPMGDIELPGVTLSPLEQESTIAKFDLMLSMIETEQGLVGEWQYNTDLFKQQTIEQMVAHFQNLLEAIAENPSQEVGTLPLMSESELHQLLVEWNDTAYYYPKGKCIHQLFEEQVEKTPDGIAVVFEQKQLTYQELNQRANQLAHHLQTLGVKPEVLVGICIERSISMVVGLLGILKAGGAYVPLDPNYPQERLSYMLSNFDIGVLITQSSLLESLPEHNKSVVCLDTDWDAIEQQSVFNLDTGVGEDNLAYVIYTSGSTGQPKGVAIEHRSVLNLKENLYKAIYAKVPDSPLRISWNGSFSFDTSVKQFIQLLDGHTLDILPTMVRFNGDALLSYLQDHKIDVFDCTPSQLELLISAGLLVADDVPLCVLIGGEAIAPSLWETLTQAKSINFYNLYGPTECTVDATLCNLRISDNPIIGRPIGNTQIYILDSHLQPVPIGVPGEIYIGGNGLARGYLNREQLTAEKFIQNPFSNSKSERLYKTGDLASYLADGNIKYLGRIDHQVKVRGFRIELGEIEAVLIEHPSVRQSIVIVREDNLGDKSLVAYLVLSSAIAPSISELRQFLKHKLPEYMIPNAFVMLDALPLTPNGKVNRKALPAPLINANSDNFVAPRNVLEQQLVQIWSDVLKVEKIGIKDNFFELGGHSLLAVHLLTQIQQKLNKDLSLNALFRGATIEELASIIRTDTDAVSSSWNPLVPLQPKGSKQPFFCVPGLGVTAFNLYHLARIDTERPFYALQARGMDGKQPPHSQVKEMAKDYIQAIQTVQDKGPYLLGGHSLGGKVAFEMAQQLQQQGHQVGMLIIFDTTAPFYNRLPKSTDDEDDTSLLCNLAFMFERLSGKNLSISHAKLKSLNSEEKLNYFLDRLKMNNLFSPDAQLSQIRGLLQVTKTHSQINYQPQTSHRIQIAIFRAMEEQSCSDPTMGWKPFSTKLATYDTPGDHITMLTEPHVQVLAQQLGLCLEQVQQSLKV